MLGPVKKIIYCELTNQLINQSCNTYTNAFYVHTDKYERLFFFYCNSFSDLVQNITTLCKHALLNLYNYPIALDHIFLICWSIWRIIT